MRDILLIVHFRIKEMPLLLRFLFAFSMLAGLLSVLALAPITTYKINDQKITYQEWWAGGHGVTMIIIGLLFSISGIGIFKKTKWARIAFLFSLSIPVFLTPVRPSIDYILALMVWIAIFGCYLFLKKSVKNYFSTAKSKRG